MTDLHKTEQIENTTKTYTFVSGESLDPSLRLIGIRVTYIAHSQSQTNYAKNGVKVKISKDGEILAEGVDSYNSESSYGTPIPGYKHIQNFYWLDMSPGTEIVLDVQVWKGDFMNYTSSVKVESIWDVDLYSLFIQKDGIGGGTITSLPAGIDCGEDCDEYYAHETLVTLTATANDDSTFAGWSGDCEGTETTCQVTMDEAKSVTAAFTLKTYSLTINKQGNGTMSCNGTDCEDTYAHGTVVNLTATAHDDSTFTGWSGDCEGTETDCQVTMDGVKSVTAIFNPKYTLTVKKSGNGAGTVIISLPEGIDCGEDCTEKYPKDTPVELTAVEDDDSKIDRWLGCDKINGKKCTIAMTDNKDVKVSFKNIGVTIGTRITLQGVITGSKKPMVFMGQQVSEKWKKIRVLDYDQEKIECLVNKKMKADILYDVKIRYEPLETSSGPLSHITTKERQAANQVEIVHESSYLYKSPEVLTIEPNHGNAKELITLKGYYFGDKGAKVKVFLKSQKKKKKVKIIDRIFDGDTNVSEITFKVPKGFSSGEILTVIVKNRIGKYELKGFTID